MSRNPIAQAGVAMINAVAALKLKGAFQLVHTSDGVEIHQRGRPVLLITQRAADDYANEMAEALHGGSL